MTVRALLARGTGAANSPRVILAAGKTASLELDPASAEGSFTGVFDVQHLVNDIWHDMYSGGSKVTLGATNTRLLVTGPITVRLQRNTTSVQVAASVRT